VEAGVDIVLTMVVSCGCLSSLIMRSLSLAVDKYDE